MSNPLFFRPKFLIIFTLLGLILAACAPLGLGVPRTGQSVTGRPMINQAPVIRQQPGSEAFDLLAVDLDTGKVVEEIEPIAIGSEMNHVVSPDGSLLAITSRDTAFPDGCLRGFELATLKKTVDLPVPVLKYSDQWFASLAFSPRNDRLAAVYTVGQTAHLLLVDLSTNPAQVTGDVDLQALPRWMTFSADGQRLMLVANVFPEVGTTPPGNNPQVQALLVEMNSLEIVWQQDLEGLKDGIYGEGDHTNPEDLIYYQAGIAADPDSEKIYLAHADSDKLTTVDFAARSYRTVDVGPERSALERLVEALLSIGVRRAQAKVANMGIRQAVLAPDGRSLYVTGGRTTMVQKGENEWEPVREPFGLQVWDVQTGTLRAKIETGASEVRLGPDGQVLLNDYVYTPETAIPWTEIYDPAQNKITTHLDNVYLHPTLRLDGRVALVSTETLQNGYTILSVVDEELNQTKVDFSGHPGGYSFWLEVR